MVYLSVIHLQKKNHLVYEKRTRIFMQYENRIILFFTVLVVIHVITYLLVMNSNFDTCKGNHLKLCYLWIKFFFWSLLHKCYLWLVHLVCYLLAFVFGFWHFCILCIKRCKGHRVEGLQKFVHLLHYRNIFFLHD